MITSTPCGEGYARVPAEMGQAFLCSLEGYSKSQEFMPVSQQVPYPLGASLSHPVGALVGDQIQEWDVSSRCIPQLPSLDVLPLDGLTLQGISLHFYN